MGLYYFNQTESNHLCTLRAQRRVNCDPYVSVLSNESKQRFTNSEDAGERQIYKVNRLHISLKYLVMEWLDLQGMWEASLLGLFKFLLS